MPRGSMKSVRALSSPHLRVGAQGANSGQSQRMHLGTLHSSIVSFSTLMTRLFVAELGDNLQDAS